MVQREAERPDDESERTDDPRRPGEPGKEEDGHCLKDEKDGRRFMFPAAGAVHFKGIDLAKKAPAEGIDRDQL